jgi:hypothetical protein
MPLSKNAILAHDDKNIKAIPVPEWGGEVCIRVLNGEERAKFEMLFAEKKEDLFKVRFVACSLCDEEGSRLFRDEDVAALSEKSSRVINRLFEACWEHSCLSEEAVEEAGKG